MVSHDLKSPLASLLMLLEMTSEHETVGSSAELKNRLDTAVQVGHQLSEMINSILEYSRQSYGDQKVEDVNCYELLKQIEFMLCHQPNIKVIAKEDLPVINTNKAKLQQVFQNLIANAMKYNDKNETLIEVGAKDKGDFFEFYVGDNGPGIRSEDSMRIFKLFEAGGTKTGVDSSTGVGLNTLKMLVEEQGGRIWVESEEGKGSTFFFEWRKTV